MDKTIWFTRELSENKTLVSYFVKTANNKIIWGNYTFYIDESGSHKENVRGMEVTGAEMIDIIYNLVAEKGFKLTEVTSS